MSPLSVVITPWWIYCICYLTAVSLNTASALSAAPAQCEAGIVKAPPVLASAMASLEAVAPLPEIGTTLAVPVTRIAYL